MGVFDRKRPAAPASCRRERPARGPPAQHAERAEHGRVDRIGRNDERRHAPAAALHPQHDKQIAPLRAAGDLPAREAPPITIERREHARAGVDQQRRRLMPHARGPRTQRDERRGEPRECRCPAAADERRGARIERRADGRHEQRARDAQARRRAQHDVLRACRCGMERLRQATPRQARLKTSVPLVPPKPKEFFNATSIFISRASFAQ